MLTNASAVHGYAIAASDGRIGSISDFLFDDASWSVRWLVVETGNWLSGRKVLLPPSVLGHPDPVRQEFSVRLSMAQVKDSPDIDTALPVSRQIETHVYDYYGWSPYWGSGLYYPYWDGGFYAGDIGYDGGGITASQSPESSQPGADNASAQRSDDDLHLRSTEAVKGYHIHARDGEIGHVEDFLLDDVDWSIRYLVVDTKNWWSGKKVLIAPRSVQQIDWTDRLVNLDVDRQMVKDSPAYDPSMTLDRAYEKQFHGHYGDIPKGD